MDRSARDRLGHAFIPSHSKIGCQVRVFIKYDDLSINIYDPIYRYLEYFITLLIAVISGCFIVEMFMTAPSAAEVLEGFIPSIPDGSVYTGISLMVSCTLTRVRPRFMNGRVWVHSIHIDHATRYFGAMSTNVY